MKGRRVALLLAALSFSLAVPVLLPGTAPSAPPAVASTAPGHWREVECRYQLSNGRPGWSAWEVKKTIRCAAAKFGVSATTAEQIARRESRLLPTVRNRYSGACGIFQMLPAYYPAWHAAVPARFRPFGGSCTNPRDNALTALWLARSGWGPWS